MKQKVSNFLTEHNSSFLIISTLIIELILYIFNDFINTHLYSILGLILIYFLTFYLLLSNKKTAKKNLFYIIYVIGLIIRTIYIAKTNIYTRQHDVGDIGTAGHLDYIFILFKTHHLPLTNNWQFYHPPFWHLLGSLWLKINDLFKVNIYTAFEGLQILTLMFTMIIMIVVDKINQKLKLRDEYRYLIDLFFAIHPTMIILSGSINNDCLLLLLETLIILLLINWYDAPNIKNTILLALTTGLCVMTKVNGAMMAVPILYVFIKKGITYFKKNKRLSLDYIKNIFIFGIISLPIGLWFPIRSFIKFNALQVPNPGEGLSSTLYPLATRFFSVNINELLNFANFDIANQDHNLPAYIIKSAIFGEYSFSHINFIPSILTILNIILVVIALIFMFKYIIDKKKNLIINILLLTWITEIIAMYIFNYKSPFLCSMDFRYIAICLLPGIIIIGYGLNNLKHKYLKFIIELLCALFIVTSTVFIIYI